MTARLFISHTSFLRQFDTKLNTLITIYFANSKFMSNFAIEKNKIMTNINSISLSIILLSGSIIIESD